MRITKLNELIGDAGVIRGQWLLGPDHELIYKSKDLEEEIRFKGPIVAAEAGALVVAIDEKRVDQKTQTNLVKLTGNWRTNNKNQIVFEVEKENGQNDVLTFKGEWDVNDSNQIIYRYTRTRLKKRIKEAQQITFTGYWDISEKNRLTYLIEGDSESKLRFRAAFQTKSILAKKGEIRYQLGVEIYGRYRLQEIRLFGKWILSRDLSLFFEIEYPDGEKRSIRFGGEMALGHGGTLEVALRSRIDKPLGVEVIFKREFFKKDAQFFIRLLRNLEEKRVESGIQLRF